MALTLIAPPSAEPLSLDEAKAHLRIDTGTEDTLIGVLITAARHAVEVRTGRALITQGWRWVLDETPAAPLVLARQPVQTIDAVSVRDAAGEWVSLVEGAWRLIEGEPMRIAPAGPWGYGRAGGVRIDFTAGYGDAAAVPEDLKQAVRLLVAHFYEQRERVGTDRAYAVPDSVDALLAPYRRVSL